MHRRQAMASRFPDMVLLRQDIPSRIIQTITWLEPTWAWMVLLVRPQGKSPEVQAAHSMPLHIANQIAGAHITPPDNSRPLLYHLLNIPPTQRTLITVVVRTITRHLSYLFTSQTRSL
jgi:hypothetical protein